MKSLAFQEGKYLTQKRTCSSSKLREKIRMPRFWTTILVFLDSQIILQTITTNLDIRYDISRMQTINGVSSYE